MKTVFTTGEAAKICKVSQQTIIRCFDNGQLKGFRVPGSRFRRIPREALGCVGFVSDVNTAVALLCVGGFAHQIMSSLIYTLATDKFDSGLYGSRFRIRTLMSGISTIRSSVICSPRTNWPTISDPRISLNPANS